MRGSCSYVILQESYNEIVVSLCVCVFVCLFVCLFVIFECPLSSDSLSGIYGSFVNFRSPSYISTSNFRTLIETIQLKVEMGDEGIDNVQIEHREQNVVKLTRG